MKRFFKENGLSIALFLFFALSIVGQSVAGWYEFNSDQVEHGAQALSYFSYLASAHFLEAIFENWESEFLQIGMYVALTALLFQKHSPESKSLHGKNEVDQDPKRAKRKDSPWPVRKGGWALRLYNHSLSLAFLALFGLSFLLHAMAGATAYNAEQLEHHQPVVSGWFAYLRTSRFWFESFQNWQSEFLSVGLLVVLSIYLRQKGSAQSKPVAEPSYQDDAA